MNSLLQTLKVQDEPKKEALVGIVSDKYCRAILEKIMYKPKSVIEICKETSIPISTAYRRVQNLHDLKLVQTSGCISDDGKKFFLYQSKVKNISTLFNGNQLEVEITPNYNS